MTSYIYSEVLNNSKMTYNNIQYAYNHIWNNEKHNTTCHMNMEHEIYQLAKRTSENSTSVELLFFIYYQVTEAYATCIHFVINLIIRYFVRKFEDVPSLSHHFRFFHHERAGIIGNYFVRWGGKDGAVVDKGNVVLAMILGCRKVHFISFQQLKELFPWNHTRWPPKII